ncbi:hypothetical protein EIP91_010378 [Steccherinum ochraceum]|uniref:AB hydrolase-1 domain-containing protein n=1 Tax=Steccherinum ochraceum TaxID=92696 RepID=A0A4R0RSU3_9APHY|nr:hypothetical protein EIP91_010378 [Steccherinum ochraceum]
MTSPATLIKQITVDDGISVFYREAGSPTAPKILLLHGFPTSSFQYRNLITRLAEKYHVLAPDFPGFGFTEVPEERKYKYTFDNLTKTLTAWIDALKLTKYAIYIFDYGSPTGLRVALQRPQAITAIITQNGNAYEEGLGPFWDTIRKFWVDPATERAGFLKLFTSFETTKSQYVLGAPDPTAIPPETYHLDYYLINRPGNPEIQVDIMFDYQNNVKLYPTFHKYFREYNPPTLAVWGKTDPFFVPAGAEAYKRDNPKAEVKFLDAGHFPLESHNDEIADLILAFLAKHNI